MVIKGPRKKAETSKAGEELFDPSGKASCLLFAKLLLPVRAEFKFHHLNNTPAIFASVHSRGICRFMHYKATRGF